MPKPDTEPDDRQPYSRPELVELGKVDDETYALGTFAAPGPDPRGRDVPQ